jgi:hypothetical protein
MAGSAGMEEILDFTLEVKAIFSTIQVHAQTSEPYADRRAVAIHL